MVLASDSRRTRSKSPAMMSPRTTLAPVPTISQRTLLRRIWMNSGSVSTSKFASVNPPFAVLEAAQDRSRRGVDQEDRQQHQGGAGKDPRQDPVARPAGSRLTSRTRRRGTAARCRRRRPPGRSPPAGSWRSLDRPGRCAARSRPSRCRARRRSRREGSARRRGSSRTRMPRDAQAQADQPCDRQDEARQSGTLSSSDGHPLSSRK